MRLQARMETLQERLTSLQNEVHNLRQQNDDLKTQNIGKDHRETQEKVSSMLQSLRDEHERVSIDETLIIIFVLSLYLFSFGSLH